MTVMIERHLPADEAKLLSEGIVGFNREAVPDLEPNEAEIRFHAVTRGEDDTIIGGLRGACYWNTLHIELLWLAEPARGKGLGGTLLEAAENFACQNHCEKALVETTSWQALPFYQRHGYELMATLANRPRGHASHYLAKTLVP